MRPITTIFALFQAHFFCRRGNIDLFSSCMEYYRDKNVNILVAQINLASNLFSTIFMDNHTATAGMSGRVGFHDGEDGIPAGGDGNWAGGLPWHRR
jgi:hypothetical protein